MPLSGAGLDEAADAIAYGVVLAAVAEFGVTRRALAAAFAAIALSDAFAEPALSDQPEDPGDWRAYAQQFIDAGGEIP
jgi:hypothetical protein